MEVAQFGIEPLLRELDRERGFNALWELGEHWSGGEWLLLGIQITEVLVTLCGTRGSNPLERRIKMLNNKVTEKTMRAFTGLIESLVYKAGLLLLALWVAFLQPNAHPASN